MHVKIEKAQLEEGLQVASRAIHGRSPLPILSHVLLKASHETLELTATDLDLGLQTRLPAEVEQPGSLTCPARLMSEIVAKLPAGPVELHLVQEGLLAIRSRRSEFHVSTLPAEEFPSLPSAEEAPSVSINQGLLKTMVRRVAVAAASQEETRAVMTGLLTILKPDSITLVGTDGRRLACMRRELPRDDNRDTQAVIPARALLELVRVLSNEEEEVGLAFTPGQVFFHLPTTSMHCRLLEGTFPDFEKVIPKEFQRNCRVGRDALLEGMKRMLIVAQEKQSPHLVRLDFGSERLRISANTPDLGSGKEEIPVVLEGDELTIAFNGRYIVDGLTVLETEELEFNLQDETRSAVLRPYGESGFDYVLMPVRLREPVLEEQPRVGAVS